MSEVSAEERVRALARRVSGQAGCHDSRDESPECPRVYDEILDMCAYCAAETALRAHAAAAVARERERIELVIVDGDWEEGEIGRAHV